MAQDRKVVPVRVDEAWLREHFDPLAVKAGMGRAPFVAHLMKAYVDGRLVWAGEDEGVAEWKRNAAKSSLPVADQGAIRANAFRKITTKGVIGGSGKTPKAADTKKGGKR